MNTQVQLELMNSFNPNTPEDEFCAEMQLLHRLAEIYDQKYIADVLAKASLATGHAKPLTAH